MTDSPVHNEPRASAPVTSSADRRSAMLWVFANLSHYHREHEKYYGESPLQDAAALLRTSRTLKALAEHWAAATPSSGVVPNPFAGASDLNDERAIETSGVLFMESGEVPSEIPRVSRGLETAAADAEATGSWLSNAMEAAWSAAERLLDFPELADLLAERHSIITHDWQSASMLLLVSHQLRRANAVLSRVDFTAAGLRVDLAAERHAVGLLFAAAELITRSAAGRLASEFVMVPTTFRAATWRLGDRPDTAVATWRIGADDVDVEVHVGPDGRLLDVLLQRWSNAEGEPFGYHPSGVTVEAERTFAGVTVPSTVRAGWWWGTDRQDEGEFFRARVTNATFHP